MPNPKHILIIRFSAMGDVAMTVPVLRALVEQYPNVKITVVTRAFFKPFFEGIQNVEVYEAELKGKHKGVLGLYKLSKELKALKFNVVADLHNVLRSKILKVFFFGKKVIQIDKGRAEKKALISGKLFQQLKTTHQRYAEVFEKLGYTIDLSKPSFPQKAELNAKLKGFITDSNKKIIGIAPFAAHKSKMYPLDKMEHVIAELSKDYNVVLFGGGKKEVEILDSIEAKYNTVNSVAGKLSFDEELKLISNLDLMLSMDSGNGHLAAMFGVKVITIWGVTHPFAGFMPFNQPDDYALLANRKAYPLIPTSIYGNKFPEGYENAAESISVETIVLKVRSVISA
ncbi:glycosyltransferase family 9 protein [Winogradskyella sp.]|jgi:ADP-heptose:LPS heptosyltransferase|uniref:glycosyltransferase family 9 protein n=1 Tax=Winogradskyella sp. TaxID=1883156 RepID=UPI0025E41B4E|nr:glycosyltransferase family 9 protein [Winogradskyella sp.]MCT4630871.1 glycosyltransferase family 9 protein [Winogradskyella sp.]